MADKTYKNYYLFFGDGVADGTDLNVDNFRPMLTLERTKKGIKQLSQKTIPAAIRDAKKVGESRTKLTSPPIMITSGSNVYDMKGRKYEFKYDKPSKSAIITLIDDTVTEQKPEDESERYEAVVVDEPKTKGKRKSAKKNATSDKKESNTIEAVVVDDSSSKGKKSNSTKPKVAKYSRGIRKEASFKGIVREYLVVDSKNQRYVDKGLVEQEDLKYATAKKIINIYPRSSRYYVYFDKAGRPTDKYKVDKETIKENVNDEPYYNPKKTRWNDYVMWEKKTGSTTTRKQGKPTKRKTKPKTKLSTSAFKMNIVPKQKKDSKVRNGTGISVSIPKLSKLSKNKFKIPKIKL